MLNVLDRVGDDVEIRLLRKWLIVGTGFFKAFGMVLQLCRYSWFVTL